MRMANIQHLATPIRAQLARPVSALELAGLLHPTPAVGGEPLAAAAPLIPALEGLDRGWYAGPVGWTDLNEDGELCVALRCALLTGRVAAATPASASSATPTRRPSWPRPRSSSRHCCRSWPAEALGHRVPHAAVQRDVRGAVGADVHERRPGRVQPVVDGRAQPGEVLDGQVVQPEELGRRRGVQAGGRGDVVLVDVGLGADGQEVEDPAAAVVHEHHGQRDGQAPGDEQRAEVVGEGDVAQQRHDRARRRRPTP